MKTGPIKTICAWHKIYFGFEIVMIDGPLSKDGLVSHGMCDECFKKQMEEIEKSENGGEKNEY